jgi:FkbM family methyltransferase
MSLSSTIQLSVPNAPAGLQLQVHGAQDQVVSERIRRDGIWEPYETELLLRLLQPGDIFIDVGANIGYFTVLAAAAVGEEGAVWAFEPDANNFALLESNIALNLQQDRAWPVQAGLSNAAGSGELFLSESNFGDHQIYAGDETRVSQPITLYQGADFLQDKLTRIDLVKVDTQGSEARVIAGLLPLLMNHREGLHIMIELTPFSLRQADSSGRELIMMLAQLGLPMWMIDHVEHKLIASTAEELAVWSDNWDKHAEARGFVNVLVGQEPV